MKRFQKGWHLFDLCDGDGRIIIIISWTLHDRLELGGGNLTICHFAWAPGAHGAHPCITQLLKWAVIERHFIQVLIPSVKRNLLLPVKFGLVPEYVSFLRFFFFVIIGWARDRVDIFIAKIVRTTFFSLTERIVFVHDREGLHPMVKDGHLLLGRVGEWGARKEFFLRRPHIKLRVNVWQEKWDFFLVIKALQRWITHGFLDLRLHFIDEKLWLVFSAVFLASKHSIIFLLRGNVRNGWMPPHLWSLCRCKSWRHMLLSFKLLYWRWRPWKIVLVLAG